MSVVIAKPSRNACSMTGRAGGGLRRRISHRVRWLPKIRFYRCGRNHDGVVSSGQTGYLLAYMKIGLVPLRNSKARVVSENIYPRANGYLYVVTGIDVGSVTTITAGVFATTHSFGQISGSSST